MAFRATRKQSSQSKLSEEKPPQKEEVSSDLSIDDVVGKPQGSDVSPKPQAGSNQSAGEVSPKVLGTSLPDAHSLHASGVHTYFRNSSYRRPADRRDFGRSGGVGSSYRPHRYPDSPSRPGGNWGRDSFGDAGPFRYSESANGSYRRDNGDSFTQDINVPTETVRGILDTMPEGHGFLRPKFTPSERDIYISQSQIRRFLLRNGDMVEGQARPPKDNERYWGLLKVEKINEHKAEEMEKRPKFEDLTPVYPNKQLKLETSQNTLSTRIIDLIAPIGFGQRGLIVSPPKAGKTTILKELAAGIAANYPDVHLMAALIGERPEEVTDISRSVKGEVLASNFDESPAEQTRIAEVSLDRAKRLVEMGKDVVILLDSITRLARAYNLVVNPSGRTLSGGFDPAALYPAKRFLGAARCVEPSQFSVVSSQLSESSQSVDQSPDTLKTDRLVTENGKRKTENGSIGGSLTVIGTALVDTGSRMDDLIYEEFKGTGNMELHLSRVLQERRIFPALDLARSGTRHDELLLGEEAMKKVTTLRHMLSLLSEEERTTMLIEKLSKTTTNQEFLESLVKG
ncbi:transcription termination factor Rho [Candidatus Gottesmanbacteria bacterium]|nr:transcription termination factor Rho [Candidatus Gottesmanbacteria bacterium]